MGDCDCGTRREMTPLARIASCLLFLYVSSASSKRCKQDEEYSCPDATTCCPLPPGEGIGCCPYPDATCCADKMHCCPHGMSCDVKGARCIGTGYQLLFSPLSGPPTKPRVNEDLWLSLNKTKLDVKKFCPNHSFTCDTDQTCCQLKDGDWGCCPLGGDAVCCPDQEHCCPHLTQCDLAAGTCTPQ